MIKNISAWKISSLNAYSVQIMASIQKRGKKYCLIYRVYDDEGKARQKWETYDTEAAAKKRKLEVEYKLSVGTFEVPKCVTVKEI